MKQVNFDRKLRRLEKKMDVPDFERGSTKIAWECLTKGERLLFSHAQKIIDEYGEDPPDDVAEENRELFKKCNHRLWIRTFDLFRETIDTLALHNNNVAKMIFAISKSSGKPVTGMLPDRLGESEHPVAETTKTFNEIGWQPQLSLEEGLIETIEYMASTA